MRSKHVVTLLMFLSGICFFSHSVTAAVIPLSKFTSITMPSGTPDGWMLEKKSGTPSMKMGKDGDIYYLQLISSGDSSFGLRKEARVDVKQFPILSWRWRADQLPQGGDVRRSSTDDQALQIYVAFKETGFPAVLNTPIIGYIWDNEAPKGWSGRSTQVGGDMLRYVVLRNKTDKLGFWYTERRNVYEDYKKLFPEISGGEPLAPTTGLQVYINTQRTKSPAAGSVAQILFTNETTEAASATVSEKRIVSASPKISRPKRQAISKFSTAAKWSAPNCLNISTEFDTNSTTLNDSFAKNTQSLVEYLVRNPNSSLLITGHTDNVGNDVYNLALSQKRAEIVKKYLVEKMNIAPERLQVKAAGDAQPVDDNETEEGRKHNRRVSIQDCPE
jgi:outer membrane protein OmpA-like peptidoglycan-associated protein